MWHIVSRDNIVSLVTHYVLDAVVIRCHLGGEVVCTHPDWPWAPSNFLYNGYQVPLLWFKWQGCGNDYALPSSPKVKEIVQLHLCSPSGLSWPVLL